MGYINKEIEAYQNLQRMQRPTFGFYASRILGRLIANVVLMFWRMRVTLIYLVAVLIAFGIANWFGWVALIATLGMAVGGHWMPKLWIFAPVVTDWLRGRKRAAYRSTLNAGRSFLVQAGILSPAQAEELAPMAFLSYTENLAILRLEESIPGLAPQAFVARAKDFESLLNAVRSSSRALPAGGVEVTFYLSDPLDEPQTREEVGQLDPEKMRVTCAVNAQGKEQAITFGDSSGMVIGGIPGSGKTAGVTSFLLPMALSPFVNLSIIDGKGGEDWTNYAHVAQKFIRGDEELAPIRDFLRGFHKTMLERLENQKSRLGTSNFWNATAEERLAAGEKFELLVIDECQGVFETAGRTKEEKEILGEIFRYLSAIVKRGRSAGFFAMFITQKPTADSLPTAIRDNAGLRLAFHLTTTAAESAVLGVAPEDSLETPRAMRIPSHRKGGAVLATDTGEFEEVRFFYVPEQVQEKLLGVTP